MEGRAAALSCRLAERLLMLLPILHLQQFLQFISIAAATGARELLFSIFQNNDILAKGYRVRLMAHHDHETLSGDVLYDFQDPPGGNQIQPVRGLVQDQDVWLPNQSPAREILAR